MNHVPPFCPDCSAYFPAGSACPACGQARFPVQTPAPPGQAIWRAHAPGGVAVRLALAHPDDLPLLIVPWARLPRGGDPRPADGGLVALRLDDGQPVWAQSPGAPVEGGAVAVGQQVIVGLGMRGPGAGEGWVAALDARTGQVRWRTPLGGAVRGAPAADEARAYAAASDGALYCLDRRDGRVVWRAPAVARAVPVTAAPVLVSEKAVTQAILVATYGHRQEEGRLVAFDGRGDRLWDVGVGGHARGTPAGAGRRVYVTAFREHPSAGVLSAFDVRTGRPAWPQPFVVPREEGPAGGPRAYGFSAGPLVHEGVVYVGSLDHHLYALDADDGSLRWQREVGGGIAAAPAWVEGLVVVGANDGCVYALDAAAGEIVWQYALGGHVLTAPLAVDGLLLVGAQGADDGAVAALPWHLGQYAWAAGRLEQAGRLAEAGDCRALAAHYSPDPAAQEEEARRAADDWCHAGEPEKTAQMWRQLDEHERAAQAYLDAGRLWRTRDPGRAAGYFQAAADLYFRLRDRDALHRATRARAACAQLPFVAARAVNVPGFRQWEEGKFTLRLVNDGTAPVPNGIRLWLGGALQAVVEAHIQGCLAPGQVWNVPLTVTPTQPESVLEIELEYQASPSGCAPLRGLLAVPIRAGERPRPPLQIGDVAALRVEVAGATAEGLTIATRDVGFMRAGGGIGAVQVAGDVGAMHVPAALPVDLADVRAMLTSLLAGQDRLARGLLAIYERQDASARAVVAAFTQALDARQFRPDELADLLAPIQAALDAICEQGVPLADEPLRQQIADLARAVQSQANVEHKLRVAIPILPTLVEYEAEIALGSQVDLKSLWDRLCARLGRNESAQ